MASNGLNDLSGDIDSLGNKISKFQKSGGFAIWGLKVKEIFKGIGATVVLVFDIISTIIADFITNTISVFSFLGRSMKDILTGNFSSIKDEFSRLADEIRNPYKDMGSDFEQYFGKIFDNADKATKEMESVNNQVAKNMAKDWAESSKDFTESEGDKRDAIAKTKKMFSGSAEDIRKEMQKSVLGNTLKTALDGVAVNGTTPGTTAITGVKPSGGASKIADLIMETNSILRDIRSSALDAAVIVP